MKYNKALDRMALAADTFLKQGNTEKGAALAARLFASAMGEPDAQAAVDIIEASNRHAYAQLQAAKAAPAAAPVAAAVAPSTQTTAAKSRLQAEEAVAPVEELPVAEEGADEFDSDPILEVEDEAEPVEEVIPAKTMASVLSKMVKNGAKAK